VIRVKICGVTRAEDARLAAELGAAAIGFVFWPRSPRYIDPPAAAAIVATLPPLVTAVGVFVDQPIDEVVRIAQQARLSAVQLHGSETLAYAQRVLQPVIKSVAVGPGFEPESVDAYPPEVTILMDAHDPVRRGGTGRTIDWSAAAAVAARRPVFLSGGLNSSNVADAIAHVQPYAVDVSSGVESAPGVKDSAKLRALFEAAHGG
jgi:phosphoribosylanthranilate isomerase